MNTMYIFSIAKNFKHISNLKSDVLLDLAFTADIIWGSHMGFTLIECALAGTPIIAYDWEWHSEFLKNDKNGILIPFKNIDQFASKTLELLRNPERAKELGARGRKDAEDLHSWEKVKRAWEIGFYDRL